MKTLLETINENFEVVNESKEKQFESVTLWMRLSNDDYVHMHPIDAESAISKNKYIKKPEKQLLNDELGKYGLNTSTLLAIREMPYHDAKDKPFDRVAVDLAAKMEPLLVIPVKRGKRLYSLYSLFNKDLFVITARDEKEATTAAVVALFLGTEKGFQYLKSELSVPSQYMPLTSKEIEETMPTIGRSFWLQPDGLTLSEEDSQDLDYIYTKAKRQYTSILSNTYTFGFDKMLSKFYNIYSKLAIAGNKIGDVEIQGKKMSLSVCKTGKAMFLLVDDKLIAMRCEQSYYFKATKDSKLCKK